MIQSFAIWCGRNWLGLALSSIAILLVFPILLLHLLVVFFENHEPPLTGVEERTLQQPNGQLLATYWHREKESTATIIFVHGTPASGAAFRSQMDFSFSGVDRMTYDRPGFGRSPGGLPEANLTYQAETLMNLVGGVKTGRVILVGHSYGGPLVLKVAALMPDRVAGVALIGGSVSPAEEHPWPIQKVGAWSAVSVFLPGPVRSCNEELLQLKADLIVLDQQLPQVRCPVLMLQGMEDKQVPAANAGYLEERFAALGKSALFEKQVFPSFNHFMMWEHPTETNQALDRFFQRCR